MRRRLAGLIVMSCADHPYDVNEEAKVPLVKWDRAEWLTFQGTLEDVKAELLRSDANLVWEGEEMVEHREHDPEREASTSFNKKYQVLVDCIEINRAIAPIRYEMDEQLRAGKLGSLAKIDKKAVQEV